MKKNITIILLLVLIPVVFSCASGAKAMSNVTFNDLQDKDWYLAEVKKMSASISIDRTDISKRIYTIRFKTARLFGTGADNAFFARYTTGKNNALSIGRVASTRAAPLFEMKDFTEYEYFQHLERVDRWDFRNGNLELHTYDENRAGVILIFTTNLNP
jgi:heat shock protein HslJ